MAGTTVASADVLQVPGDFPTIQIAINLAAADDEIVVGPGTYFEDIDFLGKRLTLRSSGGAAATTIDAIGRFEPVITIQGASADGSVIEGFTLTNGQATDPSPGNRGGGIYIDNANVTVRDSVITGNLATIGGAIYSNASNLTVESTIIEANEAASSGGGLYLNQSDFSASDTVFASNVSDNRGGAAFLIGGSSSIGNCEFIGNTALDRGGAINSTTDHQLLVFNSTFHSNAVGNANTEGRGGAIYHISTTDAVINNSLFIENSATAYGGALYAAEGVLVRNSTFVGNMTDTGLDGLTGSGSARLRNCIAWDNGTDPMPTSGNIATYSLIEGGFPGLGNLGGDSADEPLFVNRAGGDFRLMAGSPGIDAGNSGSMPTDVNTDFNGEPRVVNALDTGASGVPVFGYYIDMGAFEFQPASTGPTCFGDANGDGQIDLADLNAVLAAFGSVCP
ncbi:MAG: choice-of-anchor Q domain-containing protein [Phycisphaerales bacterium JB065]